MTVKVTGAKLSKDAFKLRFQQKVQDLDLAAEQGSVYGQGYFAVCLSTFTGSFSKLNTSKTNTVKKFLIISHKKSSQKLI